MTSHERVAVPSAQGVIASALQNKLDRKVMRHFVSAWQSPTEGGVSFLASDGLQPCRRP
jgi:hypothetical protein